MQLGKCFSRDGLSENKLLVFIFTPPQTHYTAEKLTGGLCVIDARLATSELSWQTPAHWSSMHFKDDAHPHGKALFVNKHTHTVLHMFAPQNSHYADDA